MQDVDRAPISIGRIEKQILAPVLDQAPRDRIGALIIGRRPQPLALSIICFCTCSGICFQIRLSVKSGAGAIRSIAAFFRPCSRHKQRDPCAHAGPDEDLRPFATASRTAKASSRQRLMVPSGIVRKTCAVTEIIEAQKSPAIVRRPLVQSLRFGPLHVGMEPAQPDHAGSLSGALQIGDCLAVMSQQCLHFWFPGSAFYGREFHPWT